MTHNRYSSLLESGIIGLIPVLPFLYQTDYYFNQFFVALFISSGLLTANMISTKKITVSLSDLVVAGFVGICLLNLLFVRKDKPDELLYCEGAAWILVYVLARNFSKKYLPALLCAITISGILQSLIGLLQYVNFISLHHTTFKILGSFPNPGLYGGYLAISVVACICLLIQKLHNKGYVLTLSVCVIFMTSMLVLSDSRAAWVACISGLLFLFLKTNKLRFQRAKNGKIIASLCVITIIVAIVAGLYGYKKDSANGRLLIWKVSMDMVVDAPLMGHGINNYPVKYMNYQGNYFHTHPNAKYQRLSDNNTQAFNEFIKVTCEMGFVGLVIVVALLFLMFSGKGNTAIIAMLLVLCVFSLFSYPTELFTIGVFFSLFIGLCESRRLHSITLNTRILPIFACFVLLNIMIYGGYTMIHYNKAFGHLYAQKKEIALQKNILYMSIYSKVLYDSEKYEAFIECIDRTDFPFMTADLMCDIGSAYWELGDTLKAESAFIKAMYMVPSKIWPRYLLFVLYRNCDRAADARRIASVILSSDIKIVGSIALKARKEALDYIESMR